MICKLGLALGCKGIDVEGNCEKYYDEGVKRKMEVGFCAFKSCHSDDIGIYAPKGSKKRNPLKAAKAEAKNKAAAGD